jgi:hypothetical protein
MEDTIIVRYLETEKEAEELLKKTSSLKLNIDDQIE